MKAIRILALGLVAFPAVAADVHGGSGDPTSGTSLPTVAPSVLCNPANLLLFKNAMDDLHARYLQPDASFYGGQPTELSESDAKARTNDLVQLFYSARDAGLLGDKVPAKPIEAFGAYLPLGRSPFIEILTPQSVKVSFATNDAGKLEISRVSAQGTDICSAQTLANFNQGVAPSKGAAAAIAKVDRESASNLSDLSGDLKPIYDHQKQMGAQVSDLQSRLDSQKNSVKDLESKMTFGELHMGGAFGGDKAKVAQRKKDQKDIKDLQDQLGQAQTALNGTNDQIRNTADAWLQQTNPDYQNLAGIQSRLQPVVKDGQETMDAISQAQSSVRAAQSTIAVNRTVSVMNALADSGGGKRDRQADAINNSFGADSPLAQMSQSSQVSDAVNAANLALNRTRDYLGHVTGLRNNTNNGMPAPASLRNSADYNQWGLWYLMSGGGRAANQTFAALSSYGQLGDLDQAQRALTDAQGQVQGVKSGIDGDFSKVTATKNTILDKTLTQVQAAYAGNP